MSNKKTQIKFVNILGKIAIENLKEAEGQLRQSHSKSSLLASAMKYERFGTIEKQNALRNLFDYLELAQDSLNDFVSAVELMAVSFPKDNLDFMALYNTALDENASFEEVNTQINKILRILENKPYEIEMALSQLERKERHSKWKIKIR